jgi:anti-sigma factor RsiW
MVDPKYVELINAEIDGELDVRQRAELSSRLLADPAARALRDEMRRLCKALDEVGPAEPPARLRADILAALPQMQARRGKTSWQLPKWRFAAALAGVLLTGTIVIRVMDNQQQATGEMAGTLAAQRAPAVVDMIQLAQGPVSGRVSLVREGTKLGLSLELVASSPVDVLVASEGHSVQVNGVGQAGHAAHPTMVELPGFAGDGHPVNVTFLMGGHEVARATLNEPKGH